MYWIWMCIWMLWMETSQLCDWQFSRPNEIPNSMRFNNNYNNGKCQNVHFFDHCSVTNEASVYSRDPQSIHTNTHTKKKDQKSNPKQIIRINVKLEIDQLNKNLCQSVKCWGITVYYENNLQSFLFFSSEHAIAYVRIFRRTCFDRVLRNAKTKSVITKERK